MSVVIHLRGAAPFFFFFKQKTAYEMNCASWVVERRSKTRQGDQGGATPCESEESSSCRSHRILHARKDIEAKQRECCNTRARQEFRAGSIVATSFLPKMSLRTANSSSLRT